MPTNSRSVKTTTILISTPLRTLPKVRKQNMDSIITSRFFQDYQNELDNEYEMILAAEERSNGSNGENTVPTVPEHEHVCAATEVNPQMNKSDVTHMSDGDIIAQFLAEEGIVVPEQPTVPDAPATGNLVTPQADNLSFNATSQSTPPQVLSSIVEVEAEEEKNEADNYDPFGDLLCMIDEQMTEIKSGSEDVGIIDDSATSLDKLDTPTEPLDLPDALPAITENKELTPTPLMGSQIKEEKIDDTIFRSDPIISGRNRNPPPTSNKSLISVVTPNAVSTSTPETFHNTSKDVSTVRHTPYTSCTINTDTPADAFNEENYSFDGFFSWYELNSIDTLISTDSSKCISKHNSNSTVATSESAGSGTYNAYEDELGDECSSIDKVCDLSDEVTSNLSLPLEGLSCNTGVPHADLSTPKVGSKSRLDGGSKHISIPGTWISSKEPYIDQRTYAIPTLTSDQRHHYFRFWLNWNTYKPAPTTTNHKSRSDVLNNNLRGAKEPCSPSPSRRSHFRKHRFLKWRK